MADSGNRRTADGPVVLPLHAPKTEPASAPAPAPAPTPLPVGSDRERLFRAVYDQWYPKAVTYARRYVGDAAEDAAQTTFMLLWGRVQTGETDLADTGTPIQKLIYTILRRHVANLHKEENRLDARQAAYLREIADVFRVWMSPAHMDDTDELETVALEVLSHMPARARQAWLLVAEQGLTYPEAAQCLGVSPSTVRQHLLRANKYLRAGLAACETSPMLQRRLRAHLEDA